MLSVAIIGLVAVMYVLDLAITWVNYQHRKQPLPPHAQGIYDQQKYAQWLSYTMDTLRFGLLTRTVSTALLLALLGSGAFGWLERLTNGWTSQPILQTLAFLGVFAGFSLLVGLPFDVYATFVIEEKHGFNKTTPRTFALDVLKNILLAVVLGGGVVALLNGLYLWFINNLWQFILAAWALLSILLVALFILNTKVFVKIFNKLTPLPEGALKERIQALAGQLGFAVQAISVMDASKRSTKLNAFFSGLGKTREVVLFDTLVEKLDEDEILSVLAHELGHAVHKDVPRLLAIQIGVFGLLAAGIAAVLQSPALAQAFGLSGVHFGFSLVLLSILAEPVQLLLGIPLNWISRTAEFGADAHAARYAGKAVTRRALVKLAQENLSNLNPHPLYVWIHYDHPSIPERLRAIQAIAD